MVMYVKWHFPQINQFLYSHFALQLIKRDPGVLGIRCWSQYGMLYMRHFNELDHELQARLNRAYRPAVRYMESFSSPLGAVVARYAFAVVAIEASEVSTLIDLI